MSEQNRESNSELIIAVVGVAIALLSFAVAVDQGKQSRKHNQLSVQPRLEIAKDFREPFVILTVRNNGLGTAIINDFSVYFEDSKVKHLGEALSKIAVSSISSNYRWEHGFFEPDSALRIDSEREILNIDRNKFDQKNRAILEAELKKISIRIKYQSLYGDKEWTVTLDGHS